MNSTIKQIMLKWQSIIKKNEWGLFYSKLRNVQNLNTKWTDTVTNIWYSMKCLAEILLKDNVKVMMIIQFCFQQNWQLNFLYKNTSKG